MAKISTYPLDGSPSLGDKLIGTDVNDSNATKNLTIGQILSVPGSATYVPYTGATGNVDLGSNTITANALIKVGGLSTQFLKADGSVDSNTYLTTSTAAATYVPYTGANANVDLGAFDIESTDVTVNGTLYADSIQAIGTSLTTYDNTAQGFGLLVNYGTNRVRLGDYSGLYLGTELDIDDVNQWITIGGALRVSGSVGNSGDVLVSQGSSVAPQWVSASTLHPTLDQVLTAGNTATNKDLVINTSTPGVGSVTLDGTGLAAVRVSGTLGLDPTESILSGGILELYNNTTGDYSGFYPNLIEFNSNTGIIQLAAPAGLTNNTLTLPLNNGTLAVSVNGVLADSAGDISLFKCYTALLTQSGTSAPTANVFSNTLGVAVTFTYNATGYYTINFSATVDSAKVWISITQNNNSDSGIILYDLDNVNSNPINQISLYTFSFNVSPSIALSDNVLYGTSIEIRVYP
jgi:hypothetical protein